ncbi:MAG: DUF2946 domain-containing protein [Bradyrhizobium sp.]|uniref:DUF2946 domain-containing protein n=1 Tax=Bradyrhizobium sp. TaxID=376 RepID=UPI002724D794|nr:DUF2946 domain-containing protein [Bradyrhizobium sp.]MDO9562298.1 DUF2946 domain-containing protein [Bradyrhizobium sp.]MDP3690675.1 DUF2946 domain-containing protein [Bradyrhizobium sp.]
MKWVRANLKNGARLALLALALQFGLSFGHFHAGDAQAATPESHAVTTQSDFSASTASPDANHPTESHHDSGHHPGEDCAICAIIALAGTGLSATPPGLLLPQADVFPYRVTDAAFADLNPVGLAFRPRAPPAT